MKKPYRLESKGYTATSHRAKLTAETNYIVDELQEKSPAIDGAIKNLYHYIGHELEHPYQEVPLFNEIVHQSTLKVLAEPLEQTRSAYFKAFANTVTKQLRVLLYINVYVYLRSDNQITWDPLRDTLHSFVTTHKNSIKRVTTIDVEKELPEQALELLDSLFLSKIISRSHMIYYGIPNFDEPRTLTFKEAFYG